MYGAKAELPEERKGIEGDREGSQRRTELIKHPTLSVLFVPQVTEKHYVLPGEAVEQQNGYQAV